MTATYAVHESVATITLDDGKVNALSPAMQAAINTAFDQAAAEVAAGTVKAVVLAGNGRVFSAGFELSVFASGDADAGYGMLRGGFELALRVLTFPAPVVMASTGPAIAMGSFLMLTGDHRVGSVKSRFQANEVAIGMVIPQAALEIMRMRLTPPAYSRAVSVAAVFAGDAAIDAGWADEIVEHDAVLARAQEIGAEYAATLNLKAHLASKVKARQIAIDAIQAGIDGLAEEYKKSVS